MWYHKVIGGGRCPIVDTWWQTETGGDHDLAAAGRDPDRARLGDPAAAGHRPGDRHQGRPAVGDQPGRLPRHQAALAVDAPHALRRRRALQGAVLERDPRLLLHRRRRPPRRERQLLDHGPGRRRAQRRRPPALDHGDRERPGQPSAGGRGRRRRQARRAERSGDRGVRHARIRPCSPARRCGQELRDHVVKEIGALARPDDIRFTDSLPKTRSGKIMRRLLRDIAAGVESTGDTTTLEDLGVLARLRQADKLEEE